MAYFMYVGPSWPSKSNTKQPSKQSLIDLVMCRCEVCGPVAQFQCHEVWRFYEGYQVLKLMGFVPYHPDVCAVKRLEPCTPDDDLGMQHAQKILQFMNE